jgi:hypothetical protein
MGIQITELDPNRVVGTMPVQGNLQPDGLAQRAREQLLR